MHFNFRILKLIISFVLVPLSLILLWSLVIMLNYKDWVPEFIKIANAFLAFSCLGIIPMIALRWINTEGAISTKYGIALGTIFVGLVFSINFTGL
jgi:hypothetical protein